MSNDNVNGNVNGNVNDSVKRFVQLDTLLIAVKCWKTSAGMFGNQDYATGYLSALSTLEGFIAQIPVVEAVPVVHAHWIDWNEKALCSNCAATNKAYKPPFCPHCGAKMEEEKE